MKGLKKIGIGIGILSTILLLFASCGGAEKKEVAVKESPKTEVQDVVSQEDTTKSATYKIKLGYYGGTDLYKDYEHTMAQTFKTIVEAESGGDIQVELYAGGVLGSAEEVMEGIISNQIQAGLPTEGVLSRWYPKISALAIPYLYDDINAARKMFDGKITETIKADLIDELGVRVLSVGEVGAMLHFASNKRPATPDDIKGLKIRTLSHDGYIKFLKLIGAAPTPMPWSEVYTSLQTGVVDGHFNPISAMVSFNMYEVQEYLTLTGHLYASMSLVINNEFYNSLPADYQLVLDKAAAQARSAIYGVNTLSEITGIASLKENGMEIVPLTPSQRQEYRAKTQQPMMDFYKEEFGEDWVDFIVECANIANNS